MRQGMRSLFAGVASLLLVGAAPAHAAPAMFAAEVHDFKLTTDFLHRYEAYQEAAAKDPCVSAAMSRAMSASGGRPPTIDQIVAAINASPGARAALNKAGLTAREAVVGGDALGAAGMQELLDKRGHSQGSFVSAANMAFFRQHKDELRRHARKVGRIGLANLHQGSATCANTHG